MYALSFACIFSINTALKTCSLKDGFHLKNIGKMMFTEKLCFRGERYEGRTLNIPSKPHTILMTCFYLSIFLLPITFLGYALDLLVSVSYVHYCTSTSDLSTSSSSRGLTNLRYGISHLGGGFTLRCLQRLSLPDLATQLCHWYDS